MITFNCKPQIEKLLTQLSKSCGMLFKLKHYTSISVLKSVYFALFYSYSTYSKGVLKGGFGVQPHLS